MFAVISVDGLAGFPGLLISIALNHRDLSLMHKVLVCRAVFQAVAAIIKGSSIAADLLHA